MPFLLGFGDHIDWMTYSEGLKEAQSRWSFLLIVIQIVYAEFKNLFANFSEVTEEGKLLNPLPPRSD